MDKQHFAIDRKHKRIEISVPCRVGVPGQKLFDAGIINLSLGGLKFGCNHAAYQAIIPEEQRTPGQVSDVLVAVRFTLRPPGRRAMNLDLKARLIHTERLAQDAYHVGVQFIELGRSDLARLETFIEETIATPSSDPFAH